MCCWYSPGDGADYGVDDHDIDEIGGVPIPTPSSRIKSQKYSSTEHYL